MALYRILYSLYGPEVLRQKKIRRLLLLTLSDDELSQAAETFGFATDRKAFDIALRISNQPWIRRSKVVWYFASTFSIPYEFLPSSEDEVSAREVISPFSPPPILFGYQQNIVKLLLTELRSQTNQACLLQLPTGAGKTRTVLEALTIFANEAYDEYVSAGILWLAHTEELCEQALESFRRVWTGSGSYEAHVFRFLGGLQRRCR